MKIHLILLIVYVDKSMVTLHCNFQRVTCSRSRQMQTWPNRIDRSMMMSTRKQGNEVTVLQSSRSSFQSLFLFIVASTPLMSTYWYIYSIRANIDSLSNALDKNTFSPHIRFPTLISLLNHWLSCEMGTIDNQFSHILAHLALFLNIISSTISNKSLSASLIFSPLCSASANPIPFYSTVAQTFSQNHTKLTLHLFLFSLIKYYFFPLKPSLISYSRSTFLHQNCP